MSTVSWLSCWKELRSLNLDFSHGLAQTNVLSMHHEWQQALQLSLAISWPQSLLRALAAGNQAYSAPQPPAAPPIPLHR